MSSHLALFPSGHCSNVPVALSPDCPFQTPGASERYPQSWSWWAFPAATHLVCGFGFWCFSYTSAQPWSKYIEWKSPEVKSIMGFKELTTVC